MKILMISKALTVEAYHGKLREIANLGVDLTLIVPPRWGNQRFTLNETPNYEVRVLPCFLDGHNHFHFYRSSINPIDADLVHVDEDPWSLVTFQCMRASIKAAKPAIFFTWQNIYKTYPQPFDYFERYSFKHAVGGLAGNAEAATILSSKGFTKQVAVIPQFGVDPELFRKRDVSRLKGQLGIDNKFVVGYAGRIIEAKGIPDLISALAKLPARCVLALLGSGEFESEARKLAANLGVASRILWIPHVNSLEMPYYLNAFDVLVLPSHTTRNWKEQFGRVLIEAMACETAVVGSDSGEIPIVIDKAGLLFPEGDSNVLADQLTRLESDPNYLAQLGLAGRNRVLTNFTHQCVARKTVAFYHLVLGRVLPVDGCELQLAEAESLQVQTS
ncbi:MAG TPA: glycosyltransferase [Candidatus Acidoferrum sp.]|jgi:glycosyltransferase involved in cell wall biosynthesis